MFSIENMGMKTGRQLLVDALIKARQDAGLTPAQLAAKIYASRAYIAEVEKYERDISVDFFEKYLRGCDSSVEKWLASLDKSKAVRQHPEFYDLLTNIVEINDTDQVHGIWVNLVALSEKSDRIKAEKAAAEKTPYQKASNKPKIRDKPSPQPMGAGQHKKTNRHVS